jgi:hypothetical protein
MATGEPDEQVAAGELRGDERRHGPVVVGPAWWRVVVSGFLAVSLFSGLLSWM